MFKTYVNRSQRCRERGVGTWGLLELRKKSKPAPPFPAQPAPYLRSGPAEFLAAMLAPLRFVIFGGGGMGVCSPPPSGVRAEQQGAKKNAGTRLLGLVFARVYSDAGQRGTCRGRACSRQSSQAAESTSANWWPPAVALGWHGRAGGQNSCEYVFTYSCM